MIKIFWFPLAACMFDRLIILNNDILKIYLDSKSDNIVFKYKIKKI